MDDGTNTGRGMVVVDGTFGRKHLVDGSVRLGVERLGPGRLGVKIVSRSSFVGP